MQNKNYEGRNDYYNQRKVPKYTILYGVNVDLIPQKIGVCFCYNWGVIFNA